MPCRQISHRRFSESLIGDVYVAVEQKGAASVCMDQSRLRTHIRSLVLENALTAASSPYNGEPSIQNHLAGHCFSSRYCNVRNTGLTGDDAEHRSVGVGCERG